MNETLYELLKDFEDPSGKISAGVRKTENQWIGRFALLNFGDCKKKTDWFKEIKSPLFTTKDGVGILPGDGCYWVKSTELDLIPHNYACDTPEEYERQIKAEFIPFSTKEAAEKWIEENAPKYSKSDMFEFANMVRNNLDGRIVLIEDLLNSTFNYWSDLQKMDFIEK